MSCLRFTVNLLIFSTCPIKNMFVSFVSLKPRQKKEIAFYLFLGLLPGLIAYIFIYPLRELMMEWTGLSAHYVQLYVLVLMSAGWHMCVPFLMLRYKDGLSLKESLVYLGFARLDLKGLLLVFPILTILFTFLALPYVKYVYPPLFEWLNGFQAFHMGEWHVFFIKGITTRIFLCRYFYLV